MWYNSNEVGASCADGSTERVYTMNAHELYILTVYCDTLMRIQCVYTQVSECIHVKLLPYASEMLRNATDSVAQRYSYLANSATQPTEIDIAIIFDGYVTQFEDAMYTIASYQAI